MTFMYEEDRQTALSMYGAMFDRTIDEQALIQKLVSPTRQAVVVARAYNARDRRLQVHAQSRGEQEQSEGGIPEFVEVIGGIAQDILGVEEPVVEEKTVLEDQFSFFAEEEDELHADMPELETIDVTGFDLEIPAEEPAEEDLSEVAEEPAALEDAQETEEAAPAEEDAVDDFLSGFSLPEEAMAVEANVPAEEPAAVDEGVQELMPEFSAAGRQPVYPEPEAQSAKLLKARVFPLILYILFSVPLGLAGLAILAIIALLFLALSVSVVVVGIMLLTSAFSSFSVFADILIVLGAALIILALGLLFLWLFVWTIGGAMVGLVRGIIALAKKWCYKEVEAA